MSPNACSIMSCPHTTSYTIIDVETTGFSPKTDKIIQISAIKYDTTGRAIDTYDTYLNPGIHIPENATNVNHITDEMVANAPYAEEIQDEFLQFLGDDLLVGYNVAFDLGFLNKAFGFGEIFTGCRYVDALQIARRSLALPSYDLSTAASAVGYYSNAFHNSLTDCEAVAALLQNIDANLNGWIKSFRNNTSDELDEHRAITRELRKEEKRDRKRQLEAMEKARLCNIQAAATDTNHPLYGKTIVFTGELSIERSEAAELAASVGAFIRSSVSKKTDYLVVGIQDINIVGEDGLSTKEESAYALNATGKANIKIIREDEFHNLIEGDPQTALFNTDVGNLAEAQLRKVCDSLQSTLLRNHLDKSFLHIRHAKDYYSLCFENSVLARLYIKRPNLACKKSVMARFTAYLKYIDDSTDLYAKIPLEDVVEIEKHIHLIDAALQASIDNYPKEWDCCHRFEECSDAKMCTHPDKHEGIKCGYRKVLAKGKIYYGKNCTIRNDKATIV